MNKSLRLRSEIDLSADRRNTLDVSSVFRQPVLAFKTGIDGYRHASTTSEL